MCGIFGIIRNSHGKFDYSKFCVLGIANDSRGGDSCGIFIDGKVEYGVKKERLFEDFFTKSTLLEQVDKATIALGHCRKASVGAVNIATAQPIVIQNENNETEFVLLHNGTIYNYEALAKKYIPDIDIEGLTDSQVMARIFYYKGYDVLEEYNGGSVFFIVDYRGKKPKIMYFKGASKRYSTDLMEEEERPLYFCVNSTGLIFSSISSYLLALCPEDTLYTACNNVLGEFRDGKLYGIKKYDRSKCQQHKEVVYVGQDYVQNPYIDYISYNVERCYYTAAARRITGVYFLSDWGGLYKSKPPYLATKQKYFFHGIPIANKEYYEFVFNHFKKSGKKIDQFTNDNEILIRYLSSSRLYSLDKTLYLVESPNSFIPFTGDVSPLSGFRKQTFKDGKFVCEQYDSKHKFIDNTIANINLNTIENLWKL